MLVTMRLMFRNRSKNSMGRNARANEIVVAAAHTSTMFQEKQKKNSDELDPGPSAACQFGVDV